MDRRQPHPRHGGADGQGVGEVVDVLAGAEDVDDLVQRGQDGGTAVRRRDRGGHGVEPPLEQVLHGLDVVAGDGLDAGQLGDVLGAEDVDKPAQVAPLRLAEAGGTGQDATVGYLYGFCSSGL